jgi:hypothetical protein
LTHGRKQLKVECVFNKPGQEEWIVPIPKDQPVLSPATQPRKPSNESPTSRRTSVSAHFQQYQNSTRSKRSDNENTTTPAEEKPHKKLPSTDDGKKVPFTRMRKALQQAFRDYNKLQKSTDEEVNVIEANVTR